MAKKMIIMTDERIKKMSLPKGVGCHVYHDKNHPFLVLRVYHTGRQSWFVCLGASAKSGLKKIGDAKVIGVQEALHYALKEIDAQKENATQVTLDEFYEAVYFPSIQHQHKSSENFRNQYRIHIQPVLGNKDINSINAEDILQLQNTMARHLKATSVNRVLLTLKAALQLAIDTQARTDSVNPMKQIDALPEIDYVHNPISMDKMQRLLAAIEASPQNEYLLPIVRFLALTGARRGEVLNVRWTDIDFEKAIWKIKDNKSGTTQYKPLSDAALTILVTHFQSTKSLPYPWIFANPKTGKPFSNFYRSWHRCRVQAGAEKVRIHDLRHFFATELVSAGYELYDVQKLLSHAYAETTQRYAHLKKERLLNAVNHITCPRPRLKKAKRASRKVTFQSKKYTCKTDS